MVRRFLGDVVRVVKKLSALVVSFSSCSQSNNCKQFFFLRQLDTKFANGKTAGNLAVQIVATVRSGAGQDMQVSGYDNEINEVTTDDEGRAQFTLNIPRDARTLTITVSAVVALTMS